VNVPFQIGVDLGVYYEQIAVSLGFATLLAALATFFSCRTFITLASRLTRTSLLENKAFQSFYKYHGYYWWLFLTILVVHAMSASIHTELLPKADDPDALAHWIIIGFAFGTLVALSVQFASCRSCASLIDFFSQQSPLKSRVYKVFYKFHAYYWWIFLAAVAGHVIAASVHTHIWPS
jgi:cytochrome b561